jgi:hypothetical protein
MPAVKQSARVTLSIRAGINDKGKQSRSYVQQIMGPNTAKAPSANGQVYDWVIGNADKPGTNFSKLGRTDEDKAGHFKNKFSVGDGIYRIVRPNETYTGWPETVFAIVKGGQVQTVDQNAARAAVGLPPVAVGKAKAERLADNDEDVSL